MARNSIRNNSILLSVIIPVYNVEDTLERCVESVLNQDINDMEIILVDDGSTDRSASICDKYANSKNITVIHQPNAGLSEARNKGLTIAKGKLVTFVDSDDYLSPNTYKPILDLFKLNPQYDLIEYPIIREDVTRILLDLKLPEHEYSSIGEYWFGGKAYLHTYACNKIFKRNLFDEVRFPKGKKFEDVYTLPKILKHTKLIRTTALGLYHYIYNSNGITVKADNNEDLLDLLKAHMPLINDKSLRNHKGFAEYYYHVLNIQISTYTAIGKDSCVLLPTLPYYQTWKLKLLHAIGMKNICKLFRTAKRLHFL